MGFYLNLLIVHQRPVRETEHKVWSIGSIVSIDRVTRLEKITAPRFQHLTWGGKERAAICVVGELWRHIGEKIKIPKKSDFAPPFLLEQLDPEETPPGMMTEQRYPNQREWVKPIKRIFGEDGDTVPKWKMLDEHNDVFGMSEESFVAHVTEEWRIVDEAPLLWESSETVAQWLQEMEDKKTDAWNELAKDPAAVAYLNMWRGSLREMGKIGARVVLLFDHLDIPSFI